MNYLKYNAILTLMIQVVIGATIYVVLEVNFKLPKIKDIIGIIKKEIKIIFNILGE